METEWGSKTKVFDIKGKIRKYFFFSLCFILKYRVCVENFDDVEKASYLYAIQTRIWIVLDAKNKDWIVQKIKTDELLDNCLWTFKDVKVRCTSRKIVWKYLTKFKLS